MPYTLNAGRVIVGPSGLKLAYLERNIPGAAGEDAISPTEADRLARQIVEALNLMEAARDPAPPALTDESVRADLESAILNYGLTGERARLLRANVNHVLRANGTQSAADYLAGAKRHL